MLAVLQLILQVVQKFVGYGSEFFNKVDIQLANMKQHFLIDTNLKLYHMFKHGSFYDTVQYGELYNTIYCSAVPDWQGGLYISFNY